jgi:sugar phosphate isomerase/epimerase
MMLRVMTGEGPRIGVVTEAFADRSLVDVMDWLVDNAPQVTALEVGVGGYAPTTHCDMPLLLRDSSARNRWLDEVNARGLSVAALNVWGNPLHPDESVASKHDADLRDAVRLAAEIRVDRVVALAGCPAAALGDQVPHFAGGGWLPYLEGVHEEQWMRSVEPYWSDIAEFAARESPGLLVCLELHPGTVVYNVETFGRIAALGGSIAANIDPSHFFWMGMDPFAVVEAIGDRAGHSPGKDVKFQPRQLALNGLLDHRWPRPPAEMPWNFAVVGRGHSAEWWKHFAAALSTGGHVTAIAIEHEDPFVSPEEGVPEAAALLRQANRA